MERCKCRRFGGVNVRSAISAESAEMDNTEVMPYRLTWPSRPTWGTVRNCTVVIPYSYYSVQENSADSAEIGCTGLESYDSVQAKSAESAEIGGMGLY